jgi:hypothetical protein
MSHRSALWCLLLLGCHSAASHSETNDLATADDLAGAPDDLAVPGGNSDGSLGDGPATGDSAMSGDLEPGPPTLLSVSPANGNSNADPTADLVLTFSEPMDQTSVAAAFSASPGISCSWSSNGAVATCSHPQLAWATGYSLGMAATAQSTRGPALAAPYDWSITTSPEPAPEIDSVTIDGYPTGEVPFGAGPITVHLTGKYLDGVTGSSVTSENPAHTFAGTIAASPSPGPSSTELLLTMTVPHATSWTSYLVDDSSHGMDLELDTSHGSGFIEVMVLEAITAGPSGSDTTGLGTYSSPFRSLAHCLGRASGSDTIYLKGGTYNETNGEQWVSGILLSSYTNLPGSIRIRGDGNDVTILTTNLTGQSAFVIGSAAPARNVYIDDLTLQGFASGLGVGSGTLEFDAKVNGSTKNGLAVTGTGTLTINQGEVSGNGTGCCTGTAALYSGIYAANTSTLNLSNANLHDNAAAGLYLKDTAAAQIDPGCSFNRTNYVSAGVTKYAVPSGLGAGIVIDGSSGVAAHYLLISTLPYPEVANNNNYGILINSGGGTYTVDLTFWKIHDNSTGNVLINNANTTFKMINSYVNHSFYGVGVAAGAAFLGTVSGSNGGNTFDHHSDYDLEVQGGSIESTGSLLAGNQSTATDPYPNHGAGAVIISNSSSNATDSNHRWQVTNGELTFNAD